MQSKIKDIIDASFKKMVSWREHLHAHPELSFQEVNTSAFVASNLEQLGIPFQNGIAGTGRLQSLRKSWVTCYTAMSRCLESI